MATYTITFPVKAYDGSSFYFQGTLTEGQLHGMIAAFEGFFIEDFGKLEVKYKSGEEEAMVNTAYAITKVKLIGAVEVESLPDDWPLDFPDYEYGYACIFKPDNRVLMLVYSKDENIQGFMTVFSWYNQNHSVVDYSKTLIDIKDKDGKKYEITPKQEGL